MTGVQTCALPIYWYWLDENGVMANDGLRQIKDNYYYFREDGSMVSSQWVSIPNEAVAAYVDEYAEETGEVDQEPVRYWYSQEATIGKRIRTGGFTLRKAERN